MNYMLPNQPQQPPPTPPQFQPAPQIPEKKNFRFRWPIITIPITALAFFIFIRGIEPAYSFHKLMRTWHIHHPEKLIKFACLFLVLTCVILTVKIFRKQS